MHVMLRMTAKPKLVEVGCYGIAVTRLPDAAIEQSHDDFETVRNVADALYDELLATGIDVLLDDRDQRHGVMLAELELIGIPHRVVIGDRGLKDGNVEYQQRRDEAATPIKLADIAEHIKSKINL